MNSDTGIFSATRPSSQFPLTGWISSSARPSRLLRFCFLLLITFGQASAREKETCGEVCDREALRRVRTVCVDTSYLEEGEAFDIKTFMATENQPGQPIRQIPWDFTDRCAAADAVIRVYFVQSELITKVTRRGKRGAVPSRTFSHQVNQAVLLIYDRASVRLLYRTEGQRKGTYRPALLEGPFSKLAKDLESAGR
jgi:hypothetical protein